MATGRLFSLHVVARLLDFFDDRAHWQRRLWNVGLVLSLREVLEAAEEQDRALSAQAVSWLAKSVKARAAHDPGAGSELQAKAIARYLDSDLAADGLAYRAVGVALADIESTYLARWAETLRRSDSPPNRERTARAIASHLVDAGLTPRYLHRWLTGLVKGRGEIDVSDLISEAQTLLDQPAERHELFVPFEVEPRLKAARPQVWIDSAQAAAWLRATGHTKKGIRQRGGFLLVFETHGPEEAVEKAADVTDRFLARASLGERTHGRFADTAYVADGRRYSLVRARRVEVRALSREQQLSALGASDDIDDALELLAHLHLAPAAVAAAGGWSAIESLLLGPGDEAQTNVVAADRLATLVACSWPRAELTDIAWARARANDDELALELRELATNRERAARIAFELEKAGRLPELSSGSDIAAVHRMKGVLADPRRLLLDVRGHATESLRRLYRQRNLVLHGGRTAAIALGPALRTAAPLVGAGIDRIVHGALVKKREPLQLLAQADFEIERAGSEGAPGLVDLLE
jgi:hypothetical protein